MPLPEHRVLEHNRKQDNGEHSAQPLGVELSPAIRADLLDPANWQQGLATFARATNLAVALADAAGRLIGSTINPRLTWSLLHAKTPRPLVPKLEFGNEGPGGVGCPFSLVPLKPCNCVADALAKGSFVVARDRTGLVHFAVPLVLGEHPLGALIAGQVFDQYPEQLPLEQVARQLGLSPAPAWQLARLEHPVKRATLEVYADLLATLGHTFLQTRYHTILAQSTNEELQSVNEELYSVNIEYQSKIQQLTDLNNDMDNLLQSTDIGTVFLDKDLRVRKFTPAVTNVITLLEHDVGRPLDQISYGIDMGHDDLLAQVRRVLETSEHVERDVESRSGASLLMRIDPYRDEAGRTDGVVLTFVDITEKKRAADAVNEARLLAEGIVRTVRQPLVVLDGQLHVQSVNDSFFKTFHVTREETENRLLYELGNGQWDIPSLRGLFEEILLRDAWVVDFEVRHTFEKIGERTMLLNARRMRGKGSNEILLAIEDVTERKLAEAQIKNANANLQQKNRELAEFVHTVSHDLKSPLVTIGGMLGLLKEELQEERLVAAGEFIATAEETVVGMRDMIDDLLKLSRIGTVAIDFQPVGLRQVAEEFVRKHAPELEDKGTAVSLELSEDQPTVLADRNRLVEVLDNLMVNALKYACDGPEPRITIGSETVGREVRLFVKDNGPGIGKEHHEKIFGLFQRLDESKEGTGAGLAIVKRIMEVHGGRVWVESAIGEGATFWLAFPAAVGEAAMSLSAQGSRGRA